MGVQLHLLSLSFLFFLPSLSHTAQNQATKHTAKQTQQDGEGQEERRGEGDAEAPEEDPARRTSVESTGSIRAWRAVAREAHLRSLYDEVRGVIKSFVEGVVRDATAYTEYSRKKTSRPWTS
ncbi:hypothetical protein TcBrA4_0111960 [Trypanosoma cruzi]|nr:hypothetical protein TcBrA4_0111960 [Trypanosoma cruzi]